jgi:hypothetical protein
MDLDDEEAMAALMHKEIDVATAARDVVGNEEHLSIIVSLLAMFAEEDKTIIGGSTPGLLKIKSRQMMEGYCMLYAD